MDRRKFLTASLGLAAAPAIPAVAAPVKYQHVEYAAGFILTPEHPEEAVYEAISRSRAALLAAGKIYVGDPLVAIKK